MPPADAAPVDADRLPIARSPRLVRALLIGACGLGLAGVGLTAPSTAPTGTTEIALSSAASATLLADVLPHGAPQLVVTARAAKPAARAPRASRSRPAPTKHKPAASTGKKASFSGGWARPSYASIVSPYGPRWGRMHKGVDFGASYGAPIRAVGDGIVVGTGYQGSESGYGLITIVRHSNGYYSAYAHQSSSSVRTGEKVHAGETIGYVGSTGHSTGPHLHLEIRTSMHGGQINPVTWLRKHGVNV